MPRRKEWVPKNAPKYVPGKDIAGWLGVTIWTVRDMSGDGRLPPPISTQRRPWLWDVDQVREWIRDHPWFYPRRRPGMNVLRRPTSPPPGPRQPVGSEAPPAGAHGAC